jgi:predicted AlkP superfamily phosphohydrolase/phosphomutase
MPARRKLAILGIDGADPRNVRRWIDKGILPHLGRLAARGRMGVLESTYPPVTAPAWISLMTGESPGSHGIVGFAAPSTGEYTRKVVNSSSVDSPLLWEIAGEHGSPGIVVNVPLTYPIRPLRGVLVSGMLTPEGAGFTHPPEYEAELRLLQPDYEIDLAWQDYKDRGLDLVRDLKKITRAQKELCEKLLASKPWEFFMVVFTGADRIQHCLYDHVMKIDDDSACRADVLTAAVRDYFMCLDEWLGDLMIAAGPDTNYLVVSDHGFGPVEQSVYFNRWLAEEGLLALRETKTDSLRRWKRVMNALGIKRSTLTALGRAAGLAKVVDAQVQMLNPFVGGIDWAKTRVYYYPTNGFFVNLKGREMFGTIEAGDEYESVRSDLIARLEKIRDPRNAERLIPIVKRREEIFRGPRVHQLPDVFIEFLDQPYDAFMQDYDVPSVFMKGDWANGTHRRNGLFMAAGPEIARGGALEGLEIFDVAPNALHLLGYPIPAHMDGRFRSDLFAAGAGEGARYEEFTAEDDGRDGITPEEERDLEEKLRGLGYL